MTNKEGLTWNEWLAASFCEGKVDLKILKKAWRDAEDPTEWRADIERKPTTPGPYSIHKED